MRRHFRERPFQVLGALDGYNKLSPIALNYDESLQNGKIECESGVAGRSEVSPPERGSSESVSNELRRRKEDQVGVLMVQLQEEDEMREDVAAERNPEAGKRHRSTARRTNPRSRHGEHKCRKRSMESLLEKIDRLRWRNKMNTKDEGTDDEKLSPVEINLEAAYRHVKSERDQLKVRLTEARNENDRAVETMREMERENGNLREDVSLMKNLVYKLNLELERYQTGEKKTHGESANGKLPRNYEKNFLRPVLPLLRAYAEAVRQKDDLINDLESEYRKFNVSFADVLRENERLYLELEKKAFDHRNRLDASNEVNILKSDLESSKRENSLLLDQINLEKEKLVKIQTAIRCKVEEAAAEKEGLKRSLEESRTELLVMRGKYAVLKQEVDRLKVENEARVPLPVHSASVNECRKLFDDLKSEYDGEKARLRGEIKKLQRELADREKERDKWTEEKAYLEKCNFSQAFEMESLAARIKELESRLSEGGKGGGGEKSQGEVSGLKRRLGEANQRVNDLSRSLMTTRKKLEKAMEFAEEIVRGQESLLLQLHEKQKENNYMTAQFGNLRTQLRNVEKGAQESLNSVEEKIKGLESERDALTAENRELEKVLAEREDLIRKLQPDWRDSAS